MNAYENYEKLLANKDFQTFVLNNSASLKKITNVKAWAEAWNAKSATPEQQDRLAVIAGYTSMKEYITFFKGQEALLNKVRSEFDFSNISEKQQSELSQHLEEWLVNNDLVSYDIDARASLKPSGKVSVVAPDDGEGPTVCQARRAVCIGSVEATLIMHVTVCNSALEVGDTLAWMTWGAWVGCFGAATVVYNNGIAACTSSYNQCNAMINPE